MLRSSNTELADRHREIIENPAIQYVCSLHRTIYENESSNEENEEKLLERAKKYIPLFIQKVKHS